MLTKKDFIFDKRLSERFIARGSLKRKTHNDFLASLKDSADKAEPLAPPDDLTPPADEQPEDVKAAE